MASMSNDRIVPYGVALSRAWGPQLSIRLKREEPTWSSYKSSTQSPASIPGRRHSTVTLSTGSSRVYVATGSYGRLTIQTTPSSISNSTAQTRRKVFLLPCARCGAASRERSWRAHECASSRWWRARSTNSRVLERGPQTGHVCDVFASSVQSTRRAFQNMGNLNYRETQRFAPILEWSPILIKKRRHRIKTLTDLTYSALVGW